jgi:hypothetical protein
MRKFASLFAFCLCFLSSGAHFDSTGKIVTPHVSASLRFTENLGQWDQKIKFRSGFDGGALFLEQDRLTFHFYDKRKAREFHMKKVQPGSFIDDRLKGHAFQLLFEGCEKSASIVKQQQDDFYENYFKGSDKSKWRGMVRSYHQLIYKNLYSNIDYEILTTAQGFKYNFHVQPGADPSVIKMQYVGISNIQIKNGNLMIKPEVNEIIEHKPYAYQMINGRTVQIPCEFALRGNRLSYRFPEGYDRNYELVIDPLLVFAAQSGSTADNFGMTATFDPQGNLYSGGTIFDIGYPTTPGAYSASFNGPAYYGNTDVVITKYNSTGSSLLYATYLGGGYTETVHSLIVDGNNNLCFYGVTSSTNFPTTNGAYDPSFNGGSFLMYVYNGMRLHKWQHASGFDILRRQRKRWHQSNRYLQ